MIPVDAGMGMCNLIHFPHKSLGVGWNGGFIGEERGCR